MDEKNALEIDLSLFRFAHAKQSFGFLTGTSMAKSWFLLAVLDSARPCMGQGHTESKTARRIVDRSDHRTTSPENRAEIIASCFFSSRVRCYDPRTLFVFAIGQTRGSSLFSSRIFSLAERTAVRSSPDRFSLVGDTRQDLSSLKYQYVFDKER